MGKDQWIESADFWSIEKKHLKSEEQNIGERLGHVQQTKTTRTIDFCRQQLL